MAKLPKSARDMIPQGSGGVGVLERLKTLEKRFREVINGISQALNTSDQRHASTEEVLNAIIVLVGRDAVEAEVVRQTIERLEAKAAKDKVALDEAVKTGRAAPADIIGERSIVVGQEADADGKILPPSRVQLLFQTLKQEYKERLADKKVGDVIETPPGTKFTVQEIYDIVLNPPQQAAEEPKVEEEVPTDATTKTEQPIDEEVEAKLLDELAQKADATPAN